MTHRLVIGVGGTGRTFTLRSWTAELDAPSAAVWVIGRPSAGPGEAEVVQAIDAARTSGGPLVLDDLQWLGEDALAKVVGAAAELTIWASRRPWPTSPGVRTLDDVLTEAGGAERVGLLDLERFGAVAAQASSSGRALSSELVDRWHRLAGGSPGLATDLAATGWDGDGAQPPEELLDAVTARVERAGAGGADLVRLAALAPDTELDLVAEALDDGRAASAAQRAVRAAGLVGDDGTLIDLVAASVAADLTGAERRDLHDRLALALRVRRPELAIEHLLEGSGQVPGTVELLTDVAEDLALRDPAQATTVVERSLAAGLPAERFALARARIAVAQGSGTALALLDAIKVPLDGADDGRAALGLAIDVRDLRFDEAVQRPVTSETGTAAAALAAALADRPAAALARFDEAASAAGAALSPLVTTLRTVVEGLEAVVQGEASSGVARLLAAADDFDRLGAVAPLGTTPHAVGALGALVGGDVGAADLLVAQAVTNESGGPGETEGHRLLQAYVRTLTGNHHDALAAVRAGEADDWAQRERLLLAALDAALARRSGDTTRLREAWRRAEPVLARQSSAWFLAEPLTELLAAGARIGDQRRVDPVVEATAGALRALGTVTGSVAAGWLELQVAISREDGDALQTAARAVVAAFADGGPGADARPAALAAAAGVWADLGAGTVDTDAVQAAADGLVEVGDPWEASRLLGQAALDHPDPTVARQLLEAARALTNEAVDVETGDGLAALGLSDREADVARLVAEGRTYKEIGAQLYISPKTVEHHVARIRSKLGAGSRAELLSIVREATGN